MKYILTLSFLFSQLMYSQSELDFSKKIIESLDKWIAFKKSLKAIPNSKYHAENIHNLLYVYYSKKDVKNFKKWLPEAKKQSKNKPQFLNRINTMEKKLL